MLLDSITHGKMTFRLRVMCCRHMEENQSILMGVGQGGRSGTTCWRQWYLSWVSWIRLQQWTSPVKYLLNTIKCQTAPNHGSYICQWDNFLELRSKHQGSFYKYKNSKEATNSDIIDSYIAPVSLCGLVWASMIRNANLADPFWPRRIKWMRQLLRQFRKKPNGPELYWIRAC